MGEVREVSAGSGAGSAGQAAASHIDCSEHACSSTRSRPTHQTVQHHARRAPNAHSLALSPQQLQVDALSGGLVVHAEAEAQGGKAAAGAGWAAALGALVGAARGQGGGGGEGGGGGRAVVRRRADTLPAARGATAPAAQVGQAPGSSPTGRRAGAPAIIRSRWAQGHEGRSMPMKEKSSLCVFWQPRRQAGACHTLLADLSPLVSPEWASSWWWVAPPSRCRSSSRAALGLGGGQGWGERSGGGRGVGRSARRRMQRTNESHARRPPAALAAAPASRAGAAPRARAPVALPKQHGNVVVFVLLGVCGVHAARGLAGAGGLCVARGRRGRGAALPRGAALL